MSEHRFQGHVLRRIPRLFLYRHDHPQRTQCHHPARHHDHGRAVCCWKRSADGPNGASPRTPNWGCAFLKMAIEAVYIAQKLRKGADAGHLYRLQKTALSLGLRRRPDSAAACRSNCSGAHEPAHLRTTLSFHCRLAALDRRRHQSALQHRRVDMVLGHGALSPAGGSPASGTVLFAHRAVFLQDHQDDLPVPYPRRARIIQTLASRTGGVGALSYHRPGHIDGVHHPQPAISAHRK